MQMLSSEREARYWQPVRGSSDFLCERFEGGSGQPHIHDEWQIAVAEDLATLSLGAYRRHPMRPGDVAVVPPHDVHGEAGGVTWNILYVARAVMPCSPFQRPVISDPDAAAEFLALLRQSDEGSLEGAEFVARATDWLRRLHQRHTGASRPPSRARRERPAVERTRVFLRQRPTEPVSLADAVAVAGVAPSHLVRSFSREVGLPPKSYHAQVRLALARRLLAEGKPATWVAYECGFADQSHLSRRFKQCYGLTPGEFQAQCRRAGSEGSHAA